MSRADGEPDGHRLPGGSQDRPVNRTTGRVSLGGLYGCRAGWLGCLLVIIDGDIPRELSGLVVSRRGSLEATGDLFAPYHLVDAKVPRSLRRQGSSLSWPRAGVPRRRSVPTGWTCCAGSGSCGRWSGTGIRRLGRRRVISAAGCRARSSRCARIGVIPMVAPPARMPRPRREVPATR